MRVQWTANLGVSSLFRSSRTLVRSGAPHFASLSFLPLAVLLIEPRGFLLFYSRGQWTANLGVSSLFRSERA
ncbi:hypothetical protein, partial [Halalkalibacterium halodurans]|uniref:hypothetical protein n=1 Tax=Halalkalibacterium halodurans TaxID=86665 RepID=UPI002E238EC0|nr:hypothetical protein [Halalkalibacterium halodurans]